MDLLELVGGFLSGLLIDRIWDNLTIEGVPAKDIYAAIKSVQYEAGAIVKSPLAFLEHHHWGLACLIVGRKAHSRLSDFMYGLGLALIALELTQENPFGLGKSDYEVTGNAALTIILVGVLLSGKNL